VTENSQAPAPGVTNYRIYYSDGSIYDSADGGFPPSARKVQVVITNNEDGTSLLQCGSHFYVWREDLNLWYGTDHFGLYSYLLDSITRIRTMVLFGETINNEQYSRIYQHAKQHFHSFRKDAWKRWEQKPDVEAELLPK
jgi:hypothetical protein